MKESYFTFSLCCVVHHSVNNSIDKRHLVRMMRRRKCDCGREKAAEVENRSTNRMVMRVDERGEKGEKCQRNIPTPQLTDLHSDVK